MLFLQPVSSLIAAGCITHQTICGLHVRRSSVFSSDGRDRDIRQSDDTIFLESNPVATQSPFIVFAPVIGRSYIKCDRAGPHHGICSISIPCLLIHLAFH